MPVHMKGRAPVRGRRKAPARTSAYMSGLATSMGMLPRYPKKKATQAKRPSKVLMGAYEKPQKAFGKRTSAAMKKFLTQKRRK